jgi:hypothetical protein
MHLLLFQGLTSITDWLITNNQPANYEEVAQNWLIALLVIAVGWALFSFAAKWLIKKLARLTKHKIWGRRWTIVYMLGIAVLLGVSVALVWRASLDFTFVVGTPGLFKGIFVGGLLYIILMLVLHLFGDARRDLYY